MKSPIPHPLDCCGQMYIEALFYIVPPCLCLSQSEEVKQNLWNEWNERKVILHNGALAQPLGVGGQDPQKCGLTPNFLRSFLMNRM